MTNISCLLATIIIKMLTSLNEDLTATLIMSMTIAKLKM